MLRNDKSRTTNSMDTTPTEKVEEVALSEEELSYFLSLDIKPSGDAFAEVEHADIGNQAFDTFTTALLEKKIDILCQLNEYKQWSGGKLRLSDAVWLQPGEIVALAGDFYGLPDKPICFGMDKFERTARFQLAYASLANVRKDDKALPFFQQEIKKDYQIVTRAHQLSPEIKPSAILKQGEIKRNCDYYAITRYGLFSSQYADLLKSNFDHFHEQAQKAYLAGHRAALELARWAFQYKHNDPKKHNKYLAKALARELFACHFLTDLFAAGHIRTPRKALWDYVQEKNKVYKLSNQVSLTAGVIAGLLANAMHDEDNEHGVYVNSSLHNDSPWMAYGDYRYFDKENEPNSARVKEAVVASLQDVYNKAVCEENIDCKAFRQYLPRPIGQNRFPMFKVENNRVLVRRDVANYQGADEYDENWDPLAIYRAIIVPKLKAGAQNTLRSFSDKICNILQKLKEIPDVLTSDEFFQAFLALQGHEEEIVTTKTIRGHR